MIKILDDSVWFNILFDVFDGSSREWCIVTEHDGTKHFSRRFVADSATELMNVIKTTTKGGRYELHFSVEKFEFKDKLNTPPHKDAKRLGWTMVIDLDSAFSFEKEQKIEACKKVCNLLDKYGILYLVDNRHHIWIPDWESNPINGWSELRENYETLNALETYIKYTSKLGDDVTLDTILWSGEGHLMRTPYSYCFSSKDKQIFQGYTKPTDVISLWDGKSLDITSTTTLEYSNRLSELLTIAKEQGSLMLDVLISKIKVNNYEDEPFTWVDRMLNTNIPVGFRGTVIWRILLPYLAQRKELAETKSIIHTWLQDVCKASTYYDKDLYKSVNNNSYRGARKFRYLSLDSVKVKYPSLFQYLVVKGVVKS